MEKYIVNVISLWVGICWMFILPWAACNKKGLKATARAFGYTALAVLPSAFLFQ